MQMQLRGMAHIQSCLWLDEMYLQISSLFSEAELITRLIDNFIACELPSEVDPSRQFFREIQTYHPRKSCIKKSSTCRFGFPKLPSKLTSKVQQPELTDKKSVEPCQLILHKAKVLLEKTTPPTSFWEFYQKLGVSRDAYHYALSISTRGKIVILERNLNELYINNYNQKWLLAWNGNMDLQFCCDSNATVTYICDLWLLLEGWNCHHVLKQTIKQQTHNKLVHEMLEFLRSVYLSHRQIGACEATYRLLKNMHWKDSNITTVF